jgi:AcrR family transcriptional regulator
MYKHCATEESVRRQRQLEACLLKLMLTENYAQITISQICDQAGISRKSFYRYFTSKDGCLYALLDHTIFDGAAYYLPDHPTADSSHQIYERFFIYWREHAALLDALDRNTMGQLLTERMLVYSIQEEQEFRNFFRNWANESSERSIFYICGIVGLVLSWHKNGFSKSTAHMANILSDMID